MSLTAENYGKEFILDVQNLGETRERTFQGGFTTGNIRHGVSS